jgi:hypothetical protein
VVRVCDQLNARTLASLTAALEPKDREILLTSGGGTASDAMAFAELIATRGLTVRARQFCLSACATYVLTAAPKVVVEPYTIVAFHHTGAFVVDVFADRAEAPADDPSRAPALAERAFFQRHGLDPALLSRLGLAVEPGCVGVDAGPSGSVGRIEYRHAWFVPSRTAADEMFRGRLSGWWPGDAGETESILRPTLADPELTVAYGALPAAPADLAAYARSLPDCAA